MTTSTNTTEKEIAMTDEQFYNELLPEIEAVPDEKTLDPYMPVETLSQEAVATVSWAQDDKDKFLGVNFNWEDVGKLDNAAAAARCAEAKWSNRRIKQKDALEEWLTLKPESQKLLNETLDAMEYAFNDDDDLIDRVEEIRDGNSNADHVLDFTAVADLGKQHLDLLKTINFPIEKLNQVAAMGTRLADILGDADASRLSSAPEKKIRDKAFTFLIRLLQKVRRCGKYVNREDKDRIKGYMSTYTRRMNLRARRNNQTPPSSSQQ